MKNKIGFIAIAIITVLATLGIGFSMWSQLITINGNVNTGNVTLSISNPSGTWGYKDEGASPPGFTVGGWQGPTNGNGGAAGVGIDTAWSGPTQTSPADMQNPVLIGYSSCVITDPTTVTATWHNVYPVGNNQAVWMADFDLTNTSSIPVIFHVAVTPLSPAPVSGEIPVVTVTYNGTTTGLNGVQIDPVVTAGTTVHVVLNIPILETTAQSYNGTFQIQIQAVQWNEYVPGPIQTT